MSGSDTMKFGDGQGLNKMPQGFVFTSIPRNLPKLPPRLPGPPARPKRQGRQRLSSTIAWYGEGLTEQVEAEMQRRFESLAKKMVTEAKRRCPVDTGRLRDSIRIGTISKGTFKHTFALTWGSYGVRYALYQEYGTIYHRARHYLSGARDAFESQFRDLASKIVAEI